MMLYILLTTLLAGFSFAAVPSSIKVCGRRNRKLEECVIESVGSMRNKLRDGIPELDVPSIEPMLLDEITLANASSFRAVAQKVKLFGFPDFKVDGLKVDLPGQTFKIDVSFDTIRLVAEYDVSTRLVVPIAGKGPIDIVAEGVTANVALMYKLVEHKGAKHIYFFRMDTKLKIKDYTSHFEPREGSDGALAEGINAALDGSRQEIIETITPNLEKVISERVLQLSNRMCKHFTYDELFPDRE